MKIAIYHPWIYLKSGLERTILEVSKRSKHSIKIFTSHFDEQGTYPELKAYNITEVNPVSVQRNYGNVLKAAFNISTTKLQLDDCDVLIVCCDGLGSFITLRNREIPIINLCFTPLRAVYDDEYRSRFLHRRKNSKLISLFMETVFKAIDKILWKKYSKVICISQTVKDRVVNNKLIASNKIAIAYPGIDEQKIKKSNFSTPFFFLPGRIMWTKNLELGITAFLAFNKSTQSHYKLVIAGMVDKKSQAYFSKLKALAQQSDAIEFVIEPSDDQMDELYNSCFATLFTAFNEDLGLTPMEAMARGKPVIAVNRGGPTEVIEHGKTGFLLDAIPECFASAMQTLVETPEQAFEMGRQGMQRVNIFTWRSFVKDFDKLAEEVEAI